jgi:hypothetical protein
MSHTVYTGKLYGATVKVGATAIGRWKQIVVAEKFRPVSEQMDVTDSADDHWEYLDDPLGGKGAPSCTITVSGNKPKDAVYATEILQTTAIDATVTVKVQKGTGAGKDLMTLTDCKYKSYAAPHDIAAIVDYTAVFEQTANAGVWSGSPS